MARACFRGGPVRRLARRIGKGESRRMFAEFERKGMSAQQRRRAIVAKHTKKAHRRHARTQAVRGSHTGAQRAGTPIASPVIPPYYRKAESCQEFRWRDYSLYAIKEQAHEGPEARRVDRIVERRFT